MKKLSVLSTMCLIMVLALSSCNSKPKQTIENLKTVANNEFNANSKFSQFAKQAESDSCFSIAAMFKATAESEKVSLDKNLAILKQLGIEFTPVADSNVAIGTTLENLTAAQQLANNNVNTVFGNFITVAQTEKVADAISSLRNDSTIEAKHIQFYTEAMNALNTNGNDTIIVKSWLVCPTCGDTYRDGELQGACQICNTTADQFKKF